MTRYIDADVLRETLGITGTADTCNGCKYNDRYQYCNTDNASRFSYVCECIDDAPTVDAAWNLTLQIEAFNDLLSEWVERMKEE